MQRINLLLEQLVERVPLPLDNPVRSENKESA